MQFEVNQTQLQNELEKLATYSDVPAPAVTRVVYSVTDLAARRYVKHLCKDAGLEVREDAAGNTFARWIGEAPELPAIGKVPAKYLIYKDWNRHSLANLQR